MATLALSRWQFAITTVYHFFFVPLTLGLSILVAIMETLYVRTGDETYKRMTKFWGKLFLINFAMGVATGIVQEFQFGMNWSEYSRFVGDVFGAPLAIEALLAFFLESTFLGIWIFGWDRLPKRVHAAAIWLVAIGSNLSALWILIANSFMHEPVGYVLRNGRAEMADFGALLSNGHVWTQFPHVLFGGISTAGFFVLGISAYHLLRNAAAKPAAVSQAKKAGAKHAKRDGEVFRRSFRMGLVYALIGAVAVGLMGHHQGQRTFDVQPMKMAAAEALWETEDPAALSLFSLVNERDRADVFSLRIPGLLSFLAYNRFSGEVKGINELQAQYEAEYGPGNYVPPVTISYWTFRIMVGAGFLMVLLAGVGLYLLLTKRLDRARWFLRLLPLAIALPYLANSAGWILTEVGRQPWIVQGLLRTEQGVSVAVPVGAMAFSLAAFTVLYAALMVADVYLLSKFSRQESAADAH